MRVVGRDVLTQAEKEHRGSGLDKALGVWLKVVELADWRNFPDVKNTWRTVDYVKPYTVFDIKGKEFRLTTVINYVLKTVQVLRVKRHRAYTREGP
jgi:mRNA interferase HigB